MDKLKNHTRIFYLLAFCFIPHQKIHAQSCDSNYYSIIYNDQTYINYTNSINTPDNSILVTGSINNNSPWLSKFTQQGNVIWTNTYNADYVANGYHAWTNLDIADAAVGNDSSYFAAGSVFKHGQFVDNTEIPPGRTSAMLLHIDKYGNVLWSRFIADPNANPIRFSKIITTKDGDVICCLIYSPGNVDYDKIICYSSTGTIKWISTLNTGLFSGGTFKRSFKRSMIQTNNGNIVVANAVYEDTSAASPPVAEFHFFSLDNVTGKVVWETSYQYPFAGSVYLPDIAGIFELPNGNLSFITNLNISTANQAQPTSKIINLITDNTGNLQNIFAYYPLNGAASIVDAKQDALSNNQDILMNDETGKAILMQIDNNAQITWAKKYGKAGSGLPPVCFTSDTKAYNIFLSDSLQESQLLVTEPNADLICDTTPVQMAKDAVSFPVYFKVDNITTTNADGYPFFNGSFISAALPAYPLKKSIECQSDVPCCVDVIDTTDIQAVSICEGSTYTLPDNTIVSDSGIYYVSYKTIKGCDSIMYYKLDVIKNPADLLLVNDTCFSPPDPVILHATDGYQSYTWMNNIVTPSSSYTVNTPGTYWVNVTNKCGIKTDSAHVYADCDFPIYMPSAFTPNGDGKNDVFRVPPLNKNHLIRLLVYNRWGQLIFQTTDQSKGWDGTINAYAQPTGTYVYYLEMQGLTGKKASQKGTFVLIR